MLRPHGHEERGSETQDTFRCQRDDWTPGLEGSFMTGLVRMQGRVRWYLERLSLLLHATIRSCLCRQNLEHAQDEGATKLRWKVNNDSIGGAKRGVTSREKALGQLLFPSDARSISFEKLPMVH